MKKTKHNPPKKQKPKPNFIQFSRVQQGFLAEIVNRQQMEFNEALKSVYEEIGMMEKILEAPQGTYTLRRDYSGLDVSPVVPPEVEVKVEPEKPAPQEEAESPVISKEKSSKDN